LLDEAIARTGKVDPQINAVVVKHYDYAQAQIDKGLRWSFTGVPFLLKDLDILEGTRTTSGASVYKDNVADHTGTLAQRFLDTGVTIFGKAPVRIRLDADHRVRLFGPTRNPWNLAHSSGGSSGGGRCGRCRAHSSCRPCQRRRRLDPDSRLGLRRVSD